MEYDMFNDPEFKELILEYLEYLNTSLKEIISTHLVNKDFPIIRKFGHNLKGTGAGYGFTDFTDIGKKIEFAARDEEYDELSVLIPEFEKMLSAVRG